MKRNKTKITFQTDRRYVISRRFNLQRPECVYCPQPVGMATPDEIARATGLSAREIYRSVEAGKAHFTETHDGLLLVCSNSVSRISQHSLTEYPSARPKADITISNEENAATSSPQALLKSGIEPNGPPDETVDSSLRQTKAKWVLTTDVFERLLGVLDSDREAAGQQYESIRRRLTKYFELRGCLSPNDLCDETINRVARRISEGREVWAQDPASYFYGVARFVLKEYWHSPEPNFSSVDSAYLRAHSAETVISQEAESKRTIELRLEALDHCLAKLSDADRRLVLQYYQGEKSERIRNRQNLAINLGIALNGLRIKVHRIRKALESDVSRYLQEHE